MPEGDTIHRSAARLRPALAGATVVRFEARRLLGDRPRPGVKIDDVEARGKHLLVHFDDGLSLRTHMKMSGAWHLYRTGERWRKPAHLVRALLEVDTGWVAVCFSAPNVETYHRAVGQPPSLASLGPDLCVEGADIDAAVERMTVLTDPVATIAEVLLDQRVAAGVGNVYKSEVLWACGIDPFAPVGELDDATRRRVWTTAAKLLRANLGSGPRTTHPAGLAVYGRVGQPCRRCGTPIRARRHGEQSRSTYWCPVCQPAGTRLPS